MRFLIQRVTEAFVETEGERIGAIDGGYLILIGVADADTEEIADKMIRKALNLRIFEDANGKTNLSLSDVGGSLLLVSQFTLYADCRHGNRPGFTTAGKPEKAERLYNYIVKQCVARSPIVETGRFGADMKVSLINDGPFTILLDSDELS